MDHNHCQNSTNTLYSQRKNIVLVTEEKNPDVGDFSNGEKSFYAKQLSFSHQNVYEQDFYESGCPVSFKSVGILGKSGKKTCFYLITKGGCDSWTDDCSPLFFCLLGYRLIFQMFALRETRLILGGSRILHCLFTKLHRDPHQATARPHLSALLPLPSTDRLEVGSCHHSLTAAITVG